MKSMAKNYIKKLTISAPCEDVFNAVATLKGLRGWWTSIVAGKDRSLGKLKLGFEGMDEHIIMDVVELEAWTRIKWQCEIHSSLEDWAGTEPIFSFHAKPKDRTELVFVHLGLVPSLECYGDCKLGWDHFLMSLKSYCETGKGHPFGH